MYALPQRKPNRLKNFDYSHDGAYFVTICVKDRHDILGEIVVGDGVLDVPCCMLSEIGKTVEKQIQIMSSLYADIHVDKFVIMPNHIHLIISIENVAVLSKTPGPRTPENGSSRTPTPTAAVPRFVSTLKRYTNKNAGYSIWQRSYHDHIIRNEKEYQKIWEYIDTNPLNWEADMYCTKEQMVKQI